VAGIVGAFDEDEGDAVAVIGFKVTENLVWGRHLYIEDVVTRADGRGRGHAPALMEWVLDEARRTGCGQVHVNSVSAATPGCAPLLLQQRAADQRPPLLDGARLLAPIRQQALRRLVRTRSSRLW
jgi:GNAT superfamily N-acetyltransferase